MGNLDDFVLRAPESILREEQEKKRLKESRLVSKDGITADQAIIEVLADRHGRRALDDWATYDSLGKWVHERYPEFAETEEDGAKLAKRRMRNLKQKVETLTEGKARIKEIYHNGQSVFAIDHKAIKDTALGSLPVFNKDPSTGYKVLVLADHSMGTKLTPQVLSYGLGALLRANGFAWEPP